MKVLSAVIVLLCCASPASAKFVCDSRAAAVTIAALNARIFDLSVDVSYGPDHPAVAEAEGQMKAIVKERCFDTDWTLNVADSQQIPQAPACTLFHAHFSRPIPDVYWFDCQPSNE